MVLHGCVYIITHYRTLEPGTQYQDQFKLNTALLEKVFLGIVALVVLLAAVLVMVLTKSRNKQNRFKLLDNAGNCWKHHIKLYY